MTVTNFFQFIIGFLAGTIFFTLGIGGGIYLLLSKMTVNPSTPVFSEEKTSLDTASNSENKTSSTSNDNEIEKTPSRDDDLPSGAYRARVTWSSGLSLRNQPDKSADRVGGVGYNWELIILGYSDNKEWQKVRIPSSGQEGWVKAGNVEKISE